jgi:hypothetical protein
MRSEQSSGWIVWVQADDDHAHVTNLKWGRGDITGQMYWECSSLVLESFANLSNFVESFILQTYLLIADVRPSGQHTDRSANLF